MNEAAKNVKGWLKLKARCLDFMDSHPRTGWFFCSLAVFNTIINLVTLYLLA